MRGDETMTSITPKVEDLLDLKGKVAPVTGASARIGRGVALRLAEAGASVAAHYRSDREAADVVVASVRDRKHKGLAVWVELTDSVSVERAIRAVSEELGPSAKSARHCVRSPASDPTSGGPSAGE